MPFAPEIITELKKKLDPANVKPPAPGKYGEYIEGWRAIAEANRIFGHDGWSYSLDNIDQTNCDQKPDGKWAVGYMAIVTVTIVNIERSDVGHGQGHGKSLGDAHDSAVKEAVTDALKRALRSFGNPFGLALYDKTKANVGVDIDWAVERDDLTMNLKACENLQAIKELWFMARFQQFMNHAPPEFSKPVERLKDTRKGELAPQEVA